MSLGKGVVVIVLAALIFSYFLYRALDTLPFYAFIAVAGGLLVAASLRWRQQRPQWLRFPFPPVASPARESSATPLPLSAGRQTQFTVRRGFWLALAVTLLLAVGVYFGIGDLLYLLVVFALAGRALLARRGAPPSVVSLIVVPPFIYLFAKFEVNSAGAHPSLPSISLILSLIVTVGTPLLLRGVPRWYWLSSAIALVLSVGLMYVAARLLGSGCC